MTAPHRTGLVGTLAIVVVGAFLHVAPTAHAQDDEMEPTTVEEGEDRVPTGAMRARAWRPAPESFNEPWHVSAAAGFVILGGDEGVDDDPGFAAELRVSRDLSDGFYAVGSYFLGFVRTQITDPFTGSEEDDTHDLHVPSIGVGFRLEATPEIRFFLEPRVGAVFGSDTDVAPAAGASAGVEIAPDPGFAVRITFTGLATDAELETDAGDADLDGLFAVGIGLIFEF